MTDALADHARAVLAKTRYLTLGTVDDDGRPWTTPVYFAPAGSREFYWLSAADADHSRHLVARPAVSLVVFDSTVAPYHGRAVYAAGEAYQLDGDDLGAAFAAYPRRDGDGASEVSYADVSGDSPYRMYRATASRLWVLCPREPRRPCPLHGVARDHRTEVDV